VARVTPGASTQDSLPARWLGFGRTGLSPAGFHSRLSGRIGFSFLSIQASPGALDVDLNLNVKATLDVDVVLLGSVRVKVDVKGGVQVQVQVKVKVEVNVNVE